MSIEAVCSYFRHKYTPIFIDFRNTEQLVTFKNKKQINIKTVSLCIRLYEQTILYGAIIKYKFNNNQQVTTFALFR